MAGQWKKLGDKLGKQAEGPVGADWAAMEQKIAQTPALQAKPLVGLMGKMVLTLLSVALLFGAAWWYTNSPSAEAQKVISQELIESKAKPVKGSSISSPTAPSENKSNNAVLPQKVAVPSPDQDKDFQEKEPANNIAQTVATEAQEDSKKTQESKTKSTPNLINAPALASANEQNRQEDALPKNTSAAIAGANKTAALDSQSSLNELPLNKDSDKENPLAAILDGNTDKTNLGEEAPEILDATKKARTALNDGKNGGQLIVYQDSITNKEENLNTLDSAGADQDLLNSKEEDLAAAEEFINPATGFRLQSLNMGIGAATTFKSSSAYGLQVSLDFQWERENWFFLGGISLSQDYRQLNYNSLQDAILIDSTWILNIESRQEPIITRIWVIDSFNAGHYELDTTFQTVIDSIVVQNIDTTQYQISYPKSKQIRFQYAELPLLYGYQWQRGPWRYALAGGISLQQALAINEEDYSRNEAFSLAIMLQPSISYKLNQHWGVFTRVRLQQQVIQNRLFQTNQSPYSCQVGVSYHW